MSSSLRAATLEPAAPTTPLCSWCGDPIPQGSGRYRLYGRQYHVVCWETLPSRQTDEDPEGRC